MGGIQRMDNSTLKRRNILEDMGEVVGAASDMNRNYWTMRKADTPGADDYFHCKANYEAASRGSMGRDVAALLGTAKELVDYPKNRYYKGLSKEEAEKDFRHDMAVNERGRKRAGYGIYSSSDEACDDYLDGVNLNEKYRQSHKRIY